MNDEANPWKIRRFLVTWTKVEQRESSPLAREILSSQEGHSRFLLFCSSSSCHSTTHGSRARKFSQIRQRASRREKRLSSYLISEPWEPTFWLKRAVSNVFLRRRKKLDFFLDPGRFDGPYAHFTTMTLRCLLIYDKLVQPPLIQRKNILFRRLLKRFFFLRGKLCPMHSWIRISLEWNSNHRQRVKRWSNVDSNARPSSCLSYQSTA